MKNMVIGMKIAIVSAEVLPYSKTGGLADYTASLAGALSASGHAVDVISPNYGSEATDGEVDVSVNGKHFFFQSEQNGGWKAIRAANAEYFGRKDMYGYDDDFRRFAYFARAVSRFVSGGDYDVIHCNDWQTGYIPLLLKQDGSGIPTVYTIHNLEFQGNSPPSIIDEIGIQKQHFQMEGVEFYGNASSMKAGIVYCDALATVSPTYSREIQTPEYGFGMEGIISKHSGKLTGILNGIDYGVWNPSSDNNTGARFSKSDPTGKSQCKSMLQREFALPQVRRPLVAFIGRLWKQKGMDILLDATRLINGNYQLIVLGTGDKELMKRLEDIAAAKPSYRAILRYDESLAHRIYAGADIFVMPSRFEPCGLGQMISMRYGTVPVVRRTGGLADSVEDYSMETGEGEGFLFSGTDPKELARAISDAIAAYSDQQRWRGIVQNCMKKDVSWESSAQKYTELYSSLMVK